MGVNGHVVVDASLAVKWLVEEDDSDKAHAILQSWVDRGWQQLPTPLPHTDFFNKPCSSALTPILVRP